MSDINDNIILLDILYIFITNILKLDIAKDTNLFIDLYKEYRQKLINYYAYSQTKPPINYEFNILYSEYFIMFNKYFNIHINDESKINIYTDILKFTIYFEKIISLTTYSTWFCYKGIIFLPLQKLLYLYYNKKIYNNKSNIIKYKILELYYNYGFLDKKIYIYKPDLHKFYFYLYNNNLTIYDYDYTCDPYKLYSKSKYNKLFREHLIVLKLNTTLRFIWIKAVVLFTLFIKK